MVRAVPSGTQTRQPTSSGSTRLLIAWVLFVVVGTLAPFDFSPLSSVHEQSFKTFQYGAFERDPLDFILNLWLFIPMGALLHHQARRRPCSLRFVVVVTVLAGLALSALLEYLQAFLPARDSSLVDVLANTAGGVVGVFIDRAFGEAIRSSLDRLRTWPSPVSVGALLVGFLVTALAVSGALQTGTRVASWNPDYPLLIGNEQSGTRPWRGRVFGLTILDSATQPNVASRFAAGEHISLPGSRVAAFELSGDAPYRDRSGTTPDLEWTEPVGQSSDGGVRLVGRPWLRSSGSASRLAQRVQKANAFTLIIRCASDDANQQGTARIVSNSGGLGSKNFTLDQEESNLAFRIRTRQTGPTALLETIVPGVFSDNGARDVLITYDGATLIIAVAQTHQLTRTEFTPAETVTLTMASWMFPWMPIYMSMNELGLFKIAYVVAFFLPPAALIGFFGRNRWQRQVVGASYTVAASVLLEITLMAAGGRAVNWARVGTDMLLGGMVLVAASTILSQADRRSDPRPSPEGRWLRDRRIDLGRRLEILGQTLEN